MSSLRGLLIAITFGLLAAAPARAGDTPAVKFSPDQTTAIRSIIKDYLMEHPEVLRDAITELDTREKMAEADARKKALADIGPKLTAGLDSLVIGNPEGKVTLIEFFDYNCGYCKRALDDLAKLMKDNKDLRVVLRDFPVLGPSSVDAALVALAAHQQFTGDKYWEFHRKLLSMRGVGKDQAISVAKSMGADMTKLDKDATDPKTRAAIEQSLSAAQELSINGTPTYIVGDDTIVGAQGYDEIAKRIDNMRKCGKAMCS